MNRPRKLALAALVLVAVVVGLFVLPPVLLADAPAPASLAAYVPSARDQLWKHATDGLRLPLHLRFVEARCWADGGAVALVFEEWRPPYLRVTYAYAIRGSMPTSADDAWGGGFGVASLSTDDEFVFQMGADSVRCP
jgi:hypothetical protein